MIKEIKIKNSKIFNHEDVTIKKHIPCNCDNCGTKVNNDLSHAANYSIQP